MRDRAWSGGLGCHGDKIDFIRRSWEATGRSDPGGVDFTIFLQRWAERQQNQLRRCWREAWQSFLRRTNKSLARERGRGHWKREEGWTGGPRTRGSRARLEMPWNTPARLCKNSQSASSRRPTRGREAPRMRAHVCPDRLPPGLTDSMCPEQSLSFLLTAMYAFRNLKFSSSPESQRSESRDTSLL